MRNLRRIEATVADRCAAGAVSVTGIHHSFAHKKNCCGAGGARGTWAIRNRVRQPRGIQDRSRDAAGIALSGQDYLLWQAMHSALPAVVIRTSFASTAVPDVLL